MPSTLRAACEPCRTAKAACKPSCHPNICFRCNKHNEKVARTGKGNFLECMWLKSEQGVRKDLWSTGSLGTSRSVEHSSASAANSANSPMMEGAERVMPTATADRNSCCNPQSSEELICEPLLDSSSEEEDAPPLDCHSGGDFQSWAGPGPTQKVHLPALTLPA